MSHIARLLAFTLCVNLLAVSEPPPAAQAQVLCFGLEVTIFGTGHIVGTEGNDVLFGRTGSDVIDGEAGDDTLEGGNDDDTLIGGANWDSCFGGLGNDRLFTCEVGGN
ncbi:MAG: hypothetical protein IT305_01745 [Chloroflexi bacterium]|nr:hypothetical protein [Chloroflexota bacterium]